MIIELALTIFAAFVGGAICGYFAALYKRGYICKNQSSTKKELSIPDADVSNPETIGYGSAGVPNADGLIVLEPASRIITVDEHFEILKKLYKDAYDEYETYSKRRKTVVHQNASKRVMQNIMAYDSGDMSVVIDKHTMNFSNGDEVWVANRYHSYGYVWSCKDPNIEFSNDSFRLDPYVWLRVVDLETRITENDSWKPRTIRVKV